MPTITHSIVRTAYFCVHLERQTMKYSIFFLLSFISINLNAQDSETDKPNNFIAFGAQYGIQLPGGDLVDRFGYNFATTFSLDYYMPKLNGFVGLETQVQFGDRVKEDVLAPLRLSNGALLGTDGFTGDIFLRRRGFYLGAYINKTLISGKKNPASGLTLGLGVGVLEHFIRLQNDSDNIGQIRADYAKGYDRLSRGAALKQSLTYQHLGKNRSVNYAFGISIFQGFTNPVRSIDFDTGLIPEDSRLDILLSIDAKWFIPIIKSGSRTTEEVFY